MDTIEVWPTKKTAVGLKHPHGPELAASGALWPNDSFAMRRLVDGSATKEPEKAFKEPAPAPEEPEAAPQVSTPQPSAAGPVHAVPGEATPLDVIVEGKPTEAASEPTETKA